MTRSQELQRLIDGVVRTRLAEAGYRRYKTGLHTRPLGEGVVGTAGARTSRSDGTWVSAIPMVGVSHATVESFVAALKGVPLDPFPRVTVALTLGSVAAARFATEPIHRANFWSFSSEAEVARDLPVLLDALIEEGGAAQEGLVTLAQLEAHMRTQPKNRRYWDRRPIALALLGETSQADALLEEHLTTVRAMSGPWAEEFRRFGEGWRVWLADADAVARAAAEVRSAEARNAAAREGQH